ncbi:MAG: ExbD/TolR family protein [Bacteriovoracia bacterium]
MKLPSGRRKKRPQEKLNLVPIMDAVFIFIFFLLMSAQFLQIMEIGSDVPIISDAQPPKPDKDPLALQLKIEENTLTLMRGLQSQVVARYARKGDGSYDLEPLHQKLVEIKKTRVNEENIILQPEWDISYEEIIKIMDTVRLLNNTDDAIFKKGKDGIDEKVKTLFAKIIFGNLMG